MQMGNPWEILRNDVSYPVNSMEKLFQGQMEVNSGLEEKIYWLLLMMFLFLDTKLEQL